MEGVNGKRKVAVACQGGGSHTAFTAGVLKKLLITNQERYEFVAFSGTSGGAICALLAWYGLLTKGTGRGGRDEAAKLLNHFWRRDIAASSPPESFLNFWTVQSARWQQHAGLLFEQPPNVFSDLWQGRLKAAIEHNVAFARLDENLVKPSSLMLFVGAVDVLNGDFQLFRSYRPKGRDESGPDFLFNDRKDRIRVEAILASAAIPPIFGAVHIGKRAYWDGLYSQNPPIRELPDADPDEIWVIQINPNRMRPEPGEPRPGDEPKDIAGIIDRRNELAGNLSLRQEIGFIEKINELVGERQINKFATEDPLSGNRRKYKHIEVRTIENREPLDYATKLDRDPSFIQAMMTRGERRAEAFMDELTH